MGVARETFLTGKVFAPPPTALDSLLAENDHRTPGADKGCQYHARNCRSPVDHATSQEADRRAADRRQRGTATLTSSPSLSARRFNAVARVGLLDQERVVEPARRRPLAEGMPIVATAWLAPACDRQGEPTLLISDGELLARNPARECMTVDEIAPAVDRIARGHPLRRARDQRGVS